MRKSVSRAFLAAAAASLALFTWAATAASAAPATTAHRDTPACTTSGLDIWAASNRGSAYAGGYYDTIYLTNLSGHACTLFGHAGVSAVTLFGQQIGSAAGWAGPKPKLVTLGRDSTGAILVQVGDPANYGARCLLPGTHRVPIAAGPRVYPPSRFTSKVASLPTLACYRHGPVWLHAQSVHGPRGPARPGLNLGRELPGAHCRQGVRVRRLLRHRSDPKEPPL